MSKWQKATNIAEILAILSNARDGHLRFASGEMRRVTAIPHCQEVFVYAPRKQRWGHYFSRWPQEWGGHVLVRPQETGPVDVLQRLRRTTRYVLRYTPPDVWPELQHEAQRVLARWHELEDAVRGGCHLSNYLEHAMGIRLLKSYSSTTTLRSEGADRDTIERVAEAFARRAEFEEKWYGRYDCIAYGRPCPDGSYRAGLSTYYRDTLNGHEWALLDGYRAVLMVWSAASIRERP